MFRFLVCLVVISSVVWADNIEDHIRKSLPVSSARRLVLTADYGSLRVHPGSGKTVDVDVYFRGNPPSRRDFDRMMHDFTLDLSQQGSEIRVDGRFRDGVKPYINDPVSFLSWLFGGSVWLREMHYDVLVPGQFGAEMSTSGGSISIEALKGDVNARTSGGSVTLERSGGRAVVHTSGGSIRIGDVAGDVDASTSGGSIAIERSSGSVNAHTSGGSITVHEAVGAINASTSGGGIFASMLDQPDRDCRLSTSGGSINITLGRDVHMDLNASTSGGGVWTDFPVMSNGERHQNELHGPLNGGGPLLYLRTSGGGISVRHGDTASIPHAAHSTSN